jgi:CHASE3 domain sensor protein
MTVVCVLLWITSACYHRLTSVQFSSETVTNRFQIAETCDAICLYIQEIETSVRV